jgi:hypothetical protein
MKVTFTRTAERRYRVSVEGEGVVSSWMEPAPGYDSRLPHDMAHFIVENELGIKGGIFGQLANGGNAGTFRPIDEQANRKVIKRGKQMLAKNRNDAALSEKIVYLACQRWNNKPSEALNAEGISEDDIMKVCRQFDTVSAIWTKLSVGRVLKILCK